MKKMATRRRKVSRSRSTLLCTEKFTLILRNFLKYLYYISFLWHFMLLKIWDQLSVNIDLVFCVIQRSLALEGRSIVQQNALCLKSNLIYVSMYQVKTQRRNLRRRRMEMKHLKTVMMAMMKVNGLIHSFYHTLIH